METNAERRRRKLRTLVLEHGGFSGLAERTGLSADSLEQVVKGTLLPQKKGSTERTPRGLGDSAARTIEGALGKERGWFDNDAESVDMTGNDLLLLGYFRLLDERMQALVLEHVREAAEQRAAMAESLAAALRTPSGTAVAKGPPAKR